jgi:hypothetical protein
MGSESGKMTRHRALKTCGAEKKKFFFVPKKSPVSLFIGLIGLDSHAPFFLPLFPNN